MVFRCGCNESALAATATLRDVVPTIACCKYVCRLLEAIIKMMDCLSHVQAIGATTPAFVAALSFIMLKQRESSSVYSALIPIMVS